MIAAFNKRFACGLALVGLLAFESTLYAGPAPSSGQAVIEKALVKLIRENKTLEAEVQRLAGESLSYQTQLSELKNAVNDMANRLVALEEAGRTRETKVISGRSKITFRRGKASSQEVRPIAAPLEEGMSLESPETFSVLFTTRENDTCVLSQSL